MQERLKEASLEGVKFSRKEDELSQTLSETCYNRKQLDVIKETDLNRKSSSDLLASSGNEEDWTSMSKDSLELSGNNGDLNKGMRAPIMGNSNGGPNTGQHHSNNGPVFSPPFE